MTELKPCPFCGGKGEIVFDRQMHYYIGVCKKCNAHSKARLTEEYAAESWNSRWDVQANGYVVIQDTSTTGAQP